MINQATPKETFDFQAMGCRYNAPRSGGKTAYAGLNSANAEAGGEDSVIDVLYADQIGERLKKEIEEKKPKTK